MLKIHNLKASPRSKHRRKILGRGESSGHGGQSTRGNKGHKSRSGYHRVGDFEGGKMPIVRRLPKRGFNHPEKIKISVVNINQINQKFDSGETVSPETLAEKGIIKNQNCIVKILGEGKINKSFNVCAHSFSEKARNLIEKSGGKITIIKK